MKLEDKVLKKCIKDEFGGRANRLRFTYTSMLSVGTCLGVALTNQSNPFAFVGALGFSVATSEIITNILIKRTFKIKLKNKSWREKFNRKFRKEMLISSNKVRVDKAIFDGRYSVPEEEMKEVKYNALHCIINDK